MSGEPSHIELGVRDADAARSFYGALLGWTAAGAGGPGQVSTSTNRRSSKYSSLSMISVYR